MWYFALSFLLTAFGQPAWVPGFGTLAAIFGFALFWKGLSAVSEPRTRFLIALLWYAAVQGVQLSWLATPEYMGILIYPFTLFLALGMGLQFAMLSHFVMGPLSWMKILALSSAWVICEWLRLFFLCGYTWNPAGLALADSSYSLQFASVWGIFGLSFWVILVNLVIFRKKYAVGAALALFPYLFGFVQQTWVESFSPITNTLKVALVQTNLAPEEKEFDPKMPHSYVPPLDQWEAILSALKEEKQADLIVLPEAALPLGAHTASYELNSIARIFPEETFPPLIRPYATFYRGSWRVSNAFLAQALANQYNAHVIIGLDDRDIDGKYNAAFHFRPMNLMPKRYEKQILAPIAEYIPLGGWQGFARFIGQQYGIYGSFDPGKEGKIFQTQVPVGISICLEETFTAIMRQLRLKGAAMFVSVSNDAYFPRTKLGWQHYDHGRVRAVENGVPLLRSCNSGITCGIDCFGRPVKILNSEKNPSALFFSLPVRSFKTLYTFWGDAAILTQSFLLIGIYLFVSRKKKLP